MFSACFARCVFPYGFLISMHAVYRCDRNHPLLNASRRIRGPSTPSVITTATSQAENPSPLPHFCSPVFLFTDLVIRLLRSSLALLLSSKRILFI